MTINDEKNKEQTLSDSQKAHAKAFTNLIRIAPGRDSIGDIKFVYGKCSVRHWHGGEKVLHNVIFVAPYNRPHQTHENSFVGFSCMDFDVWSPEIIIDGSITPITRKELDQAMDQTTWINRTSTGDEQPDLNNTALWVSMHG